MRTIRLGRLAFIAMTVFLSAIDAAPWAVADFSGRWTIEPAPSPGAGRGGAPGSRGDMGSAWGQVLTITQDANRLTVEYAFFTRGDMQPPLKFIYGLDGSETRNSVMMGRGIQQQSSRTAWDGDKLVITTIHSFSNPATGKMMTQEVVQKLSLSSPASLLVETVRAGVLGGPPSTVRTVYTKS